MSKQSIRPYEIQIWSLSDKYITTLNTSSDIFLGQIFSPEMNLKEDGTGTLKFSVPMYIRENGSKKENPAWYNLINGQTLQSLRKLKVIFNKGNAAQEIFEFVIKELKESHSKGELMAEITAESLAFQELGKIGYKIVLSQSEFELDYENWFNTKDGEEPIASLNYWCDKIFSGTDWSYVIEMDWSTYDGTIVKNYSLMTENEKKLLNEEREAKRLRRLDKIYEEEYTSSWALQDNIIVPKAIENFKEKARIVESEKSNIYNITQTIAETFEVFCKYRYRYDDNFHIVGKECVFYNNFIKENDNRITITYPYNSSEISRTMDSTDVTTKMYVVPIEDDSISNGYITISNASANRSGEDYIFNFDYLYQTGAITEEQYQAVDLYERQMFIYNETLKPLSDKIAKNTIEKNDLSAEKTLLTDAQSYAIEQMNKAKDTILAIVGDDGTLEKDVGKPDSGVFLLDSTTQKYYVNITQEGVNVSTLKLFRTFKSAELTDEIVLNNENFEYDEAGNLIKIINIKLSNTTSLRCYMTYQYSPKLHWQKIYDTYARRLNNDKTRIQEIENELSIIDKNLKKWNEEYEKTLKLKKDYINDFNIMMGTAIREGSWQSESYKDFGDKNIDTVGPQKVSSNYLTYLWDKEYFENEQLAYYESGINQDKIYYPVFDITNDITKISPHKDELCLFYGEEKTAVIASQLTFGFYKKNDDIKIGLLVIDNTILEKDLSNAKIGYITSSLRDDGSIDIKNTILIKSPARISEVETYDFVYPRIKINSTLVKTGYEDISIKVNDTLLEKYKDYYALSRDEALYLTIKPQYIVSKNTYNIMYETYYVLSNASICLYLDALEVSKNSAFPQTSYDVKISYLDTEIISNLYDYLGVLTNINDIDLKFENVQGYISEIKMDLNSPWKDSITIKNYKTKFEDLFTRIVASSEQMKTNSYLYDTAASAFNSSGSLKVENIQNSLTQSDLIYSFMNGELTITQDQGIWGTSDKGVVAYRGGGIFCATNVDENGNWIWNTGITPSGINAALLTAGQIDTNRIRIFSGDNVRFQMNGDGLFAYRYSDITGESNPNEYVVHNSEGLFLTNKILEGAAVKDVIDLVEVSWDGLIIRNKLNEKVFYADTEGNLTLKGHIEAESGTIGGWEIQKNSLSSGNTGMASGGTTTPYKAFWAGANKGEGADKGFYVMSDGTMKASGVNIEGTINASGGTIGNVTIQEIEDNILGIKVIENSGTSFKYASNENGIYEIINEKLKFTIETTGLQNPTFSFKKSSNGETWYDFNKQIANSSFEILNTEMVVNNINVDIMYVKIIASEDEKNYEFLIILYNLYDGKSGKDGIVNYISLTASSLVFLQQDESESFLPESITVNAELNGNLVSSNNHWYFNNVEQTSLKGQSSITIYPDDVEKNISLVIKCENIDAKAINDFITITKLYNGKEGQDGIGISKITNYYLATNVDQGITISSSGWTKTIQSITPEKRFLWNYEKITYSNDTISTTSPLVIGVYGEAGKDGADGKDGINGEDGKDGINGEDGKDGVDGVGIESIVEYYQISTSNTTEPTSWTTTVPKLTNTNKYLWNYEVITYTNGSKEETKKRVIGVYGDKGEDGADGEAGYAAILTNESAVVPCDAEARPLIDTVETDVLVYIGTTQLTTSTSSYPYFSISCDYGVVNDNNISFNTSILNNLANNYPIIINIYLSSTKITTIEKKIFITKVISEDSAKLWLEFNGDNYYKFYTNISGTLVEEDEDIENNIIYDYSYNYNPVSIEASIAYTANGSEKKYMTLPQLDSQSSDYTIYFYLLKENTWERVTSGISRSSDGLKYLFSLSYLDSLYATNYNINYIKIAIVKNDNSSITEYYSEIKQIVWGTSDNAAKFDFVASGAYWNVYNLNYTFNSEGFSIIKRENESEDSDRERIFYVDNEGNLYISGIINASAGKLGAWNINDSGIYTTRAGLFAAVHSVYYDVYNDLNGNNFFSAIGESPTSEQDAANKSVGSELVFYAGDIKSNRNALYKNFSFITNKTYAFTVLSDGLVYVDRIIADGTIYSNNSFNIIKYDDDSNLILDYHILGNTNYKYIIFDNTEEQLFLGVGKLQNDNYGLMVMDNGIMYAGDGNIRLASEGLYITKDNNRFSSGISVLNNSSNTTALFWINTTSNSIQNISPNNTSLLIQSNGKTFISDLYVSNIETDEILTRSIIVSENFEITNFMKTNIENESIDFNNDVCLNGNALTTNVKNLNGDPIGGILIQDKLIRGNTFSINDNTGISTFNTIHSSNIVSSVFTQDRISSVNGTVIVMNSFRIKSWNKDGSNYIFTLENDDKFSALEIGYIFSIEKNNVQCRFIVTNKTSSNYTAKLLKNENLIAIEEKDIVLIQGVPETSIYDIEFLDSTSISFKLRDYENFDFIISTLTDDNIIYKIGNIELTNLTGSGQEREATFSGDLYQEIRNNSYISNGNYLYSAILSISSYPTFSKIYLRAIDDYPEISFYRSNFIEDKSSISQSINLENLNSLILKIGNLSNIVDSSFGGALSGNGLYAENAYLKGSLVLPKAGITDISNSSFNYDNWNSLTLEEQIIDENIYKDSNPPTNLIKDDLLWLDTNYVPSILRKWKNEDVPSTRTYRKEFYDRRYNLLNDKKISPLNNYTNVYYISSNKIIMECTEYSYCGGQIIIYLDPGKYKIGLNIIDKTNMFRIARRASEDNGDTYPSAITDSAAQNEPSYTFTVEKNKEWNKFSFYITWDTPEESKVTLSNIYLYKVNDEEEEVSFEPFNNISYLVKDNSSNYIETISAEIDHYIEQENVWAGGNGINLFNINDVSATVDNIEYNINNYEITLSTTNEGGQWKGVKSKTFTIYNGITYTLSATLKNYESGYGMIGLRGSSDNTFLTNARIQFNNELGQKYITFTPNEDKEVYLSILCTNDSVLTGNLTFSNIQLEKNSQVTTYSPWENIQDITPTNNTKLTICSTNILSYPYSNYGGSPDTYERYGITWTSDLDGIVTASGTSTNDSIYVLLSDAIGKKYPAGKYYISGCPSGGSNSTYYIGLRDKNSSIIVKDFGSGANFVLEKETVLHMYICIASNNTIENLIFKPKLEFDSSTNFEKYQLYDEKIISSNSLYGTYYTPDTIRINMNGGLSAIHKTSVMILDGVNKKAVASSFECAPNTYAYAINIDNARKIDDFNIICSHFNPTSKTGNSLNKINGLIAAGVTSSGTTNLWIFSSISNVDDFNEWLKDQYDNNKPVTIIYELENQITETLYSIAPITLSNNNVSIYCNGKNLLITGYGSGWESIDKLYIDKSPIRIWAGADANNRDKAPFIVTENGFVYASQGVFKGSVYASDGIFSGYIQSTGVLVDNNEDFFIARKKTDGVYNSTDYLINFSFQNGLEIYDNGFVVFSGQPRSQIFELYLDYDGMINTGEFNYQLPYVTILEKDNSLTTKDTLVTKNLNVFEYKNLVQDGEVIIGDFYGVEQTIDIMRWYSYSAKRRFETGGNWKDYYASDINNNQTDYTLKINRNKKSMDFGPDESSLNVSILNGEINMTKNVNSSTNSNIRILAVDDGLNFYVE